MYQCIIAFTLGGFLAAVAVTWLMSRQIESMYKDYIEYCNATESIIDQLERYVAKLKGE